MNLEEAIIVLGTATNARFDIYALAGPLYARKRAELMTVLTGVKTPQSKAGIHRLQAAFFAATRATGESMAARDDSFREYCEGFCSSSTHPQAAQLNATLASRRERAERFCW